MLDRNVYGIIAEYIEINRQPYVLEIVCHTEENILLSSYGKSQFIDKISNYNKQYYQDVLTKTYDRRYYEEYVINMNNIITLAIIDANGFKEINDHFGHAAGDEALKNFLRPLKIALEKMIILSVMVETIYTCFQDIEYGDFKMLLNRISDHVQNIFVDDDVQLSVSIGGMYNINNIDEALAYADKLMYQGKKKHKKLL